MRTLLWLLLCLLISQTGFSQPGSLQTDSLFFQQKANFYQNWLDEQGVGTYLKVRELGITSNELSLYLEFPFQDLDSIISAWDHVKVETERQSGLTLEEQLFYKFILFMEIRQSSGNIQIYDTYNLREEPLFYRGIYFDQDSGKVVVESSDPRASIEYVSLTDQFSQPSVEVRTVISQDISEDELFSTIEKFSEELYERQTCPNRNPTFTLLQRDEHLRFRVIDLCKVVLVDETPGGPIDTFLRLLGYPTNNNLRELLVFTISYKTEQGYSGGTILIQLDGKFGSGFFKEVARGAYQDMEIKPRFMEALREHAEQFKLNLQTHLQNP